MYTLHNAARLLGVSISTLRRWMDEDDMEITRIETDRKRIYLAYDDILALSAKHRPLKVPGIEQGESNQELIGLYSISEVASLLGAKRSTVKVWVANADIEKKVIMTDRKRLYISYTGLVTLADKHNRTIAYDKVRIEQADNTQEECHSHDEKLYSVIDAALFLGVSEDTIRNWLSLYKIEKKRMADDRKRVYISYSDIILLESKQKHSAIHAASMTNNIKEIRYRLEQIEAGLLKLEKYIEVLIYAKLGSKVFKPAQPQVHGTQPS